jgi:hypothetical protein
MQREGKNKQIIVPQHRGMKALKRTRRKPLYIQKGFVRFLLRPPYFLGMNYGYPLDKTLDGV